MFQPTHRYLHTLPELSEPTQVTGPYRILDLKGRRGLNPTSIHTSIQLGPHPLSQPEGTVRCWFFALEDLACSFGAEHMRMDNPHYSNYALLSDCPTPRDYGNSHFYLAWFRFNELRAQFYQGMNHWKGLNHPQKAWVQAVPFNYFDQHHWYEVTFTWSDAKEEMRLYVNGVLLGTNDRFHRGWLREPCGETLYAGSPALCHSTVEMFDQVLDEEAIYQGYRDAATDYDPLVEKKLRHHFSGTDLAPFQFVPDKDWSCRMDLTLTEPEHLKAFYLQGYRDAVHSNPEGLHVRTPALPFVEENTEKQIYLWTEQTFEGNIYLEFEWMTLEPNGLALLMIHASGMAREDFMADYPRKTSGKMTAVHGENVRNYHWEFYREMNDTRNDVGTAFSRKNPLPSATGLPV
ncbi:MAG: DUF1961 family protein [Blastochloris sp.]|nr:DUF1961 family protein [Blastochloris sp.]